ncbi:MAG TPA: hypothetical protein VLI69_03100 [Gammaproteobacteria bacterium]|nr:hypothetical protein [Gammaproteobacteria bacterium]
MNEEKKDNVKMRLCRIPFCDAKGNVEGYTMEYTNGLTLFAQKRQAALDKNTAQKQKIESIVYSRNSGRRRV